MIAYLKGKIINKTDKSIILEVEDIGYEVFLPEKVLIRVKIDEKESFYIYHQQKENAQELYGFESLAGREFFIQLISVSGVGPKSALNILAMADINSLQEAIVSGDAEIFKKVSGIGSKTAERIVVELKNKFGKLVGNSSSGKEIKDHSNLEIFEALNTLGFNDNEIREVYNKIPKDLESVSDKIKAALKLLKKI